MTAQLNIPKLRFPGFEGEWEVQKMESYFELISGQHLGPLEYTSKKISEGLPYFTGPSDFTNYYESVSKWTVNKGKIAKKGDVLITVKGSGVGTYFLLKEIKEVVIGRQLMSLRSKDPDTAEFVSHILISKLNWFQGLASGNMIPGLARNDINTTELTFPSLPEQTKIASFLSKIDKKLTQLKKKKELLEQYKKGMMQKIFSQEVRFKDEKGEEFADWEEKTLGEVGQKKSSNISANKIEDNFGDYVIYGASGVLKYVDFYEEENDYISVVKDGAGVGRLFYCKGKSSVLGTMEMIKPMGGVNPYFLYCLLSNIDFSKYVTGSTIPHVYFKDYKNEGFSLPVLTEQTKIANFLSTIDKKITDTQTQIEKAEQWKKGLLQQLFV